MKEEDIHFMFNDIIQRSEQVFSQGAESDIYHLPSLLESLASIVKEMKQVSSDWLNIHHIYHHDINSCQNYSFHHWSDWL